MQSIRRENVSIILWLFTGCFLIFTMVIVGGITRLTGSGLSMVDWNLFMGTIPPLNYQEWVEAGKDVSNYPDPTKEPKGLMEEKFDDSELAIEADKLIQNFQKDASREAGIFHHLITLPTYHETALGTSVLSEGYFGDQGMLAYVKEIQRQEIRRDMSSVKHQDLAGSTVGDTHKEYFSGDNALKAGGEDNTMNQF